MNRLTPSHYVGTERIFRWVRFCGGDAENFESFAFVLDFQPIIGLVEGRSFGHEAVLSAEGGEGNLYRRVPARHHDAFEQTLRERAVEAAVRLRVPAFLGLNLSASALSHAPQSAAATIRAANRAGFPLSRLVFEIGGDESIGDDVRLCRILAALRQVGVRIAFDDFGAAHSGLRSLAAFQPEIVKLDVGLTRDIGCDRIRQALVKSLSDMGRALGFLVVAQGVETEAELRCLRGLGIDIMQGDVFASPLERAVSGL